MNIEGQLWRNIKKRLKLRVSKSVLTLDRLKKKIFIIKGWEIENDILTHPWAEKHIFKDGIPLDEFYKSELYLDLESDLIKNIKKRYKYQTN